MTKARPILLCLACVFALSVVLPTSAWAAHEFQRCINVGVGGSFENSRCESAGGTNEWAWRVVPEGATLSLQAGGIPPVTIYSAKVRFRCTTIAFTGEAKPAAGILGEFKLKNCAFTEREATGQFGNPKGCVVATTTEFKLKGEMVNGTVEPAFEFGASGGKSFTTLKANEPGSGVGCTQYTFESTAEGKGEKCVTMNVTVGAAPHNFACVACNSEFLIGTEGALLNFGISLELTPGKEWWRST
jgi:hypothetical protein